jgi:hypothetical protein
MAAILTTMHMQTADDLFGTPQGSPRTDKLIAASIPWAEQIMKKIDEGLRFRVRGLGFSYCSNVAFSNFPLGVLVRPAAEGHLL